MQYSKITISQHKHVNNDHDTVYCFLLSFGINIRAANKLASELPIIFIINDNSNEL